MARTTVKGVRLTPQELKRAERVRGFYPEATEEAAFTRLVYLRGLLLIEAEVAAAGGGLPPGHSAASLAALAMPRVLPALQLLAAQGVLPGLVVVAGAPLPPPAGDGELIDIEASAADDVADLGAADFL